MIASGPCPFSLTLAAYETTVLYAAIPNNTNSKSVATKTTKAMR